MIEKYVVIDKIRYRVWTGLYELSSRENKVKIGECRVIDGVLFYARFVEKRFFGKSWVNWYMFDLPNSTYSSRKELFKKKFGG